MKKFVVGIITTFVLIIVLGQVVPALWPTFISSDTSVQALTDNSTATTTFQAFWPIVLLIIGLGVAVGLIMYAIKRFNLGGSGGYATVDTILLPFFFISSVSTFTSKTIATFRSKCRSFGGCAPNIKS